MSRGLIDKFGWYIGYAIVFQCHIRPLGQICTNIHEQTLPTQTKYNDHVITSSHQDIEQRHSTVPIIEELELPK